MNLDAVLAALPRVSLVGAPTPVHRLERFGALVAPGGPTFWIKRDDRTLLALGGNKLRKLELLIGAARAAGADTVITLGAAQSNHAAQTAAAAMIHGMQPVLLLRGSASSKVQGNLLLDRLYGADVRLLADPPADWAVQVAAEVSRAGGTPYVVPYGGSNALGALGYAAGALELSEQCRSRGLRLDEIVVTSSSGGTQAGLALARANGALDARVLGISVDLPAHALAVTVHDITESAATEYGLQPPSLADIYVDASYVGPGYGAVTPLVIDAIRTMARTEGLLTDPVYTGKALAGLIDLARKGRWSAGENVLFWHTGGVAALLSDAYAAPLIGDAHLTEDVSI